MKVTEHIAKAKKPFASFEILPHTSTLLLGVVLKHLNSFIIKYTKIISNI